MENKKTLVILILTLFSLCLAETQYMALFMDGSKVGYAIRTRIELDSKVTTSEKVHMSISRFNIPITMDTTETSIETTAGEPIGFEVSQKMSGLETKYSGNIDKKATMTVLSEVGGAQQKSQTQWPLGALLAEGARLEQLKKGLKPGTEYNLKMFVPSMAEAIDIQVRIGTKKEVELIGKTEKLFQMVTIMQTSLGPIQSISYVDDEMNVKKNITPVLGMQIEMIACEKQFALGQLQSKDLTGIMFIDSPEALGDVSKAESIGYRLIAKPGEEDFSILVSDNQMVRTNSEGVLVVVVTPAKPQKGVRLPYRNLNNQTAAALEPTRYLQSDDKKIIALAKKAIGNTKDAAEAAKRIEDFVSKYITNKHMGVGYASALEILQTREGDCTEFAVLSAAMCRAVGIPSRVVAGIAYVEDYQGLVQQFGGHAWFEAYIGDKWVGYDAAFKSRGQGYDAGHIALAIGNGDPKGFLELAATMGRFKIDKVIVKKRSDTH